jgi:hypothetical protein
MNPRNERDESKTKPETRDPQKPKRFKLVRLEERIAPRSGNEPFPVTYNATRYAGGCCT